MPTLLTPNDKPWLDAWQQSPAREVFAHPAYAALFEDGKTSARALYWEGEQGSVLYPFLLRELRDEPFWKPEIGEGYDMATPYGYGGPVVVSGEAGQSLFRDFYAALEQWAGDNRVITEFVRFSLFSEAPQAYYGKVVHHNDNIVVDLSLRHDALWRGFRHKVRKNIHTAQAAGISIEVDPTGSRLDDFLAVYHHTLDRRLASPQYYLQRPFFQQLQQTLPGHCCYFHALHQGEVIASELVLLSATRLYSYLGGTFSESFHLRPGDLLKYHIMQWACEKGHQQFIIGGGHRPHDGIFAFKKAFAPSGIVPFFVGKKVFDGAVYAMLTSGVVRGGFFPGYRS
jgi:lipid II:glycine glycyltransferase (peptidoglycan interpeptide bridge formation enzyme)